MLGDSLSAQNFTLSNIQMILFGNVSQGMKYRVSHCKMLKCKKGKLQHSLCTEKPLHVIRDKIQSLPTAAQNMNTN